MNLHRIDLNLLVYLDVLLRERNVTQAAQQLNLSQPAMSNGLRRLRTLFDDPLLVRTSEGMTPTERALELEPLVRDALTRIDQAVQPRSEFRPGEARGVFRIMASDYAESTLLPRGARRAAQPGSGNHPGHHDPFGRELSGCRARQGRHGHQPL
jgi:DNA-binding transcriptional LysR family regulator